MRAINLIEESVMVETEFSEVLWNDLVNRVSKLFHFDPIRNSRIKENRVMKLVAALPFIAGCRNPMRISMSHIAVYIMASSDEGKDVYLHTFSDNESLMTRLERISHFDGGDQRIIDRGMKMIAHAMLGDHHHDASDDASRGKYNPINTKAWDYNKLIKKLESEIRAVDCPELDKIMNIDYGPLGLWAP